MIRSAAAGVLVASLLPGAAGARQTPTPSPAPTVQTPKEVTATELAAAIDTLGSFDFATRTDAARTVRRAPAALAIPALAKAARAHAEGYVRYRALVLLAGFGDANARDTMRAVMSDANDRLRGVVYEWFERHPDPEILPALLDALAHETSEFVRPPLIRAVAAHRDDARAKQVLLPLVMRGEDFFRGAVITALGDYRAGFAAASIADVARLEGPLQDDAVTALGRIGDPAHIATLLEVRKTAPAGVQPTIAAALCLLGADCNVHEPQVRDTLTKAIAEGQQPIVRGASHAMAMLAIANRPGALSGLFDRGVAAADPARAAIALSTGLVALRNAGAVLDVLEARADQEAAIELLRDAFDMLSEDFEEECFYMDVRRAYWAAAPGSARQKVAEALIRILEF